MVFNKDLYLFKALTKKLPLRDTLNIYFTYKKVRKGCLVEVMVYKNNSNKIDEILQKYNIKFNKKQKNHILLYFISNTVNPNKIEFITKNNKLSNKKIGKFLDYECLYDNKVLNKFKKYYHIFLTYENYNSKNIFLYGFKCSQLNIGVINKTLNIIKKMNYYIKKYLSSILTGIIKLNIQKF